MKYATGKHALAICDRCGLRAPYRMLVTDGDKPGLRVHPSCRDVKHPTEKPFNADEGIALKNPRPDRDVEVGDNGQTLVEAMFPNDNNFGGAT